MANTQTANRPSNSRQRGETPETDMTELSRDFVGYLREYARDNPEAAALWCFGIGFILGWKMKLW